MNQIPTALVKRLIEEQFPEWAHLEVRPVKFSGHDNRTFHLGDEMSVRLPSDAAYAPQVEKENKWLPILSKELSLLISTPVAKGNPSESYPWPWSINKWIEGETVTKQNIRDLNEFAADLGAFLVELQSIDASNGPIAGAHNFYRGGLIKDGKLCAVIDFGILGVGDPSCDAAMAWTFFDKSSRNVFKGVLCIDEEMWNRARGWALWKALITYDANKTSNKIVAEESYRVIQVIVDDYER
ncbi:aminoglycoside phosphotransferase family protein [Bacillus wiedmannii]|uniref:aminoglycoside phosphotransferase family protein n=1 Tax=Bacillus wiedmannii TaxID=1890302 RepID=UPI000D03E8D6|nr:aminoglycoside phosphotransferase family protein [Bacillus wiedmannii]PRT31804.1 acetyltransferase [Bacillus wiedmannii]PRT44049.1 acetyltransferase [Bacillus wiedmannii]